MLNLRISQQKPIVTLIGAFVVWKLLIFSVAALSPGVGYDTSTEIWLPIELDGGTSTPLASFSDQFVARKLARWDAFYFVSIAERGHIFEQEWAFGWGFSKLVEAVAILMPRSLAGRLRQTLAAVVIANVSHLLSVIILFLFCRQVIDSSQGNNPAFISACLHIIAPAGIFLSAPYGESLFSFLSFTGYLCYARMFCAKRRPFDRTILDDAALMISGMLFGISCLVRSNGLFNGLVFAYDLIISLPHFPRLMSSGHGARYIISLVAAGLLVAAGFAMPQYLAYSGFCTEEIGARDWCNKIPPSIYLFVQQNYWNVGFFRYWTVSNIPLFILAAPMLTIMTASAVWVLRIQFSPGKVPRSLHRSARKLQFIDASCLTRLALPQIALTLLAFTNFHVQVITRIACAYPIVYLWIAQGLKDELTLNAFGGALDITRWTVRWMAIYAIVQGGLFASFLPPA